MRERILITGGAGFIGSHVADELLRAGHQVRALDSLSAQVHGASRTRPSYLSRDVELMIGDVRDPAAVRRAIDGVDSILHFAAAVGVGQSMYQIDHYADVNTRGTAVLLEAILERPVRKLVVASSMSIYGEGSYRDGNGRVAEPMERTREQLGRGDWDPRGEHGERLTPAATPENKRPALASVYALSKYDQERLCLMIGDAYGFPAVALRFFNVYGPRQALSNPYTGVLAIFASRLLNENPPCIFEDGEQRRDFVSVHDIARACALALDSEAANGQAINIGSGRVLTVREIAARMAEVLGKTYLEPEITGRHRVGDIRHCFADITRARTLLGYCPRVEFSDGLAELAEWLAGEAAEDYVPRAYEELATRGLTL
ncbi:MAG TPA: NAD-dependent epimerase/dehydratase family protein [Gemmatimonadaceae bacterium]|jgi:dTDP-L-rhamnose 4-epimerase|nr:NAD-dependent epimerase/dehydratase family protein [Gemmatimonadaceae bacterium]